MAHVVVSVRMTHAGAQAGAASYLDRARAVMARAEALGATLAAWSAQSMAFVWESDSLEEAILFVQSLREDAPSAELAWSSGVAEGEMREIAAGRGSLSWGEPLVLAESLARIAEPGEALVDEHVSAVRAGQLAAQAAKTSTDSGKRVTGLRLNLAKPWKTQSMAKLEAVHVPPPPSLRSPPAQEPPPIEEEEDDALLDQTGEVAVPSFVRRHEGDEPGALELADAVALATIPPLPSDTISIRPLDVRAALVERVEEIAGSPKGTRTKTLIALMKARGKAEGPVAQCQASLALAIGLGMAGRANEALLEALDALARARETGDVKAAQACLALIAKLYTAEGRGEDAALLRMINE